MLSYTKLWNLLDKRNINSSDLYKLCKIHPSTVAKMKRGQNIETDSIDKICAFLKCQPADIMNYIEN